MTGQEPIGMAGRAAGRVENARASVLVDVADCAFHSVPFFFFFFRSWFLVSAGALSSVLARWELSKLESETVDDGRGQGPLRLDSLCSTV